MNLMKINRKDLEEALNKKGLKIVKDEPFVSLHEYSSYEEYKDTQVFHNKKKLEWIWADDSTLKLVADRFLQDKTECGDSIFKGICHGARNGYEVKKLGELIQDSEVYGTDISDTAT